MPPARTPRPTRPAESTHSAPRLLWSPAGLERDVDTLTVEEPLELRVGNVPVAVVMRTPGHDEELGTGFALTEGLVRSALELERVHHCSTGEHADNVLLIVPRADVDVDVAKLQRNFYASSSCGICGKRTIEQALASAPAVTTPLRVDAHLLAQLPAALRAQQPTFDVTGGLHAAGLFDETGELLVVREDIGRHNAVDKVIGWALRAGVAVPKLGLVISGRASYEVAQKALAAGVSLVVAVGAVSSLAVELAQRSNMTLVGFAREDRLSVYGAGHGVIART